MQIFNLPSETRGIFLAVAADSLSQHQHGGQQSKENQTATSTGEMTQFGQNEELAVLRMCS